jgi:tRNA nucleotidyltransferase/poly(A) polymerase
VHRLVAAGKTEGWAPDALLRLEAIIPPHRARIDALIERLRLSRAEAARLHAWAAAPEADPSMEERALAELLYRHGREGVTDRLRHALAREFEAGHAGARDHLRKLLDFAERWQRPTFPVTGKDLVATGLPPGPDVGERLRQLEERWIASGFALSREELLAQAAEE